MRLNPLDPNSPDLAPARGDGVSEPLVLPEVVTRSTRPIELDPALDAPVVEQIALRGPSHSSGKYLVVDENTLVYHGSMGCRIGLGCLPQGRGAFIRKTVGHPTSFRLQATPFAQLTQMTFVASIDRSLRISLRSHLRVLLFER